MESESERKTRLNREFWESLTPEYLDQLLEEIARKSEAFLDSGNLSMPTQSTEKGGRPQERWAVNPKAPERFRQLYA